MLLAAFWAEILLWMAERALISSLYSFYLQQLVKLLILEHTYLWWDNQSCGRRRVDCHEQRLDFFFQARGFDYDFEMLWWPSLHFVLLHAAAELRDAKPVTILLLICIRVKSMHKACILGSFVGWRSVLQAFAHGSLAAAFGQDHGDLSLRRGEQLIVD